MRSILLCGVLAIVGCSQFDEHIDTEPCTDLVPGRFNIVRQENVKMDKKLFSYGASPLSTFDGSYSAESIRTYFENRTVNNRNVEIVCQAPSIILFKLNSDSEGDLLNGLNGFYVLNNNHYSIGPFLNKDFEVIIQADVDAI